MTSLDVAFADSPPVDRLQLARARLEPPVHARAPAWPAMLAALAAAVAALGAAAAVILGGPALGAPSDQVRPPVSHMTSPSK